MGFAVVLVSGTIPDRSLLDGIENAELIVAADGGVRIARKHGLPIHVVVGDLDSASPDDLAWARAEGADIIEYPIDKNSTDLELALEFAESAGVDRIVAVGVDGGRLDHELGNWATLCKQREALVEVRQASGLATILHGGSHGAIEFQAEAGELISLLPRFGDATGVTTSGLRWGLENATLAAASTRGVSNEFLGGPATIFVAEGTLMVVRPSTSAPDAQRP